MKKLGAILFLALLSFSLIPAVDLADLSIEALNVTETNGIFEFTTVLKNIGNATVFTNEQDFLGNFGATRLAFIVDEAILQIFIPPFEPEQTYTFRRNVTFSDTVPTVHTIRTIADYLEKAEELSEENNEKILQIVICDPENNIWGYGVNDTDGDGEYDSCDEFPYEDFDLDGFNALEDCNNHDASINPNATEVCDGIDNNCDLVIDEGCNNVYEPENFKWKNAEKMKNNAHEMWQRMEEKCIRDGSDIPSKAEFNSLITKGDEAAEYEAFKTAKDFYVEAKNIAAGLKE